MFPHGNRVLGDGETLEENIIKPPHANREQLVILFFSTKALRELSRWQPDNLIYELYDNVKYFVSHDHTLWCPYHS